MDFYYKVYDRYMRALSCSLLLIPLSVAAAYAVYWHCGLFSAAKDVIIGIVVAWQVGLWGWRCTLLCPHCGRHSLVLLPNWERFFIPGGIVEHSVHCWRCHRNFCTDIGVNNSRRFLRASYLRTRGKLAPGGFSREYILSCILYSLLASLLVLLVMYALEHRLIDGLTIDY